MIGATYATRVGFLYDTSPFIGYFRKKKFVVVIFVFWKFWVVTEMCHGTM
jgi:hypothetical protein